MTAEQQRSPSRRGDRSIVKTPGSAAWVHRLVRFRSSFEWHPPVSADRSASKRFHSTALAPTNPRCGVVWPRSLPTIRQKQTARARFTVRGSLCMHPGTKLVSRFSLIEGGGAQAVSRHALVSTAHRPCAAALKETYCPLVARRQATFLRQPPGEKRI
jgi:hypothetical protein